MILLVIAFVAILALVYTDRAPDWLIAVAVVLLILWALGVFGAPLD